MHGNKHFIDGNTTIFCMRGFLPLTFQRLNYLWYLCKGTSDNSSYGMRLGAKKWEEVNARIQKVIDDSIREIEDAQNKAMQDYIEHMKALGMYEDVPHYERYIPKCKR